MEEKNQKRSSSFLPYFWHAAAVQVPTPFGTSEMCSRRLYKGLCPDGREWDANTVGGSTRAPGTPATFHTPRPANSMASQPARRFKTLHSPLSSHDSDWKELRDCTSDRLSRALYGCEGFSSRGFLERQGSRSTTLAERKRWRRSALWGQGLWLVRRCALTQSKQQTLPEPHWLQEPLREKGRSPKTYKPASILADSQNRKILNKPACGAH